MTTTIATAAAPGAVPATSSRNVWLIGGALLIAGAAGAAGLALRQPTPAAPVTATESLAQGESLAPAGKAGTPVPPAEKAAVAERAAPKTDKPAPAARPAPKPAPATTTAQAAPVCVDCGTVQAVRTVTKKGEGSGVGAVAGGVVGAVIGNQVGKGDGRKVATVLGAIGGGMAGHEIEKRSKSTTVFAVDVKMDDGSLRTIEQGEKPAVGARVQVDGKTLKALPAAKA